MASKKAKMDLPGRRPGNPPPEECARRWQTAAWIVWKSTEAALERGVHLPATIGLSARHYANARARMGIAEGDQYYA
jgi:hypothetical protein